MRRASMRSMAGMMVAEAALLAESEEIVHAFSTRQGGVSDPPFATLNLGQSVGDDPAAVEENRRRFFGAFGIAAGRVVRVWQAHGNGVVRIDAVRAGRPGFPGCLLDERGKFDALITQLPDLALTVSTADCLPILIHDPARRAVAAVHAGWRGTSQRIVARALDAMQEGYGTNPGDCRAAIGPGIRGCCFEVDSVVTDAMAAALPDWGRHARANRSGHWLLDLAGVNRAILESAGVGTDRIEDVGLCTCCRNDLFFSHRADKGRTGRMMNFIALRADR